MKALLTLLGSIGLTAGSIATATLATTPMTQINTMSAYSSILVDVAQDISQRAANSGGAYGKSTGAVRFSDIQTELHMDYEAFQKADFTIQGIGIFKISTHLNPQVWSEVIFRKEVSSTIETRYVAKLHHEAQNGWAKQKGDIVITLKVTNDNSMSVQTDVTAESYGSVSSTITDSRLRGISFK